VRIRFTVQRDKTKRGNSIFEFPLFVFGFGISDFEFCISNLVFQISILYSAAAASTIGSTGFLTIT
jgi:hypothetical protein